MGFCERLWFCNSFSVRLWFVTFVLKVSSFISLYMCFRILHVQSSLVFFFFFMFIPVYIILLFSVTVFQSLRLDEINFSGSEDLKSV